MVDLSAYRSRVESRLQTYLNVEGAPTRLQQAMQYAVFNGGKRIRPTLVYLAAEAAGAPMEHADATASAVEMVHTYSLIHDDLPAMDDDDLRRGKPTCHIKFDEATAILAGDALQAAAFEAIAEDAYLPVPVRLMLISRLATAIGAAGMVGGQVIDLESEHQPIDEATLVRMHRAKTGALISTSVVAGAIIAAAPRAVIEALSRYGYSLGLAFQIKDDLLDVTGNTEVLGKRAGADVAHQKTTFVSVHGVDNAAAQLDSLRQDAISCLEPMKESGEKLRELADFVANRDH